MSAASRQPAEPSVAGYRLRLFAAMTLLAVGITGVGLYLAWERMASESERDLQGRFQQAVAALHTVQEVRHAVLTERCRQLVRRPRIHAALEDNALDLLYASAHDELRDVMQAPRGAEGEPPVLQARFYRFLDAAGQLITPEPSVPAGSLTPAEAAQLAQPGPPEKAQLGYFPHARLGGGTALDEVLATPAVSGETGDTIAALVLGFPPANLTAGATLPGLKSGLWVAGRLYYLELSEGAQATLKEALQKPVAEATTLVLDAQAYRLYTQALNPGSLYPPAYEVCLFSLAELQTQKTRLLWQAAGTCAGLLLLGFGGIHLLAGRLARPVEALAQHSAEHRTQRVRAEEALEHTTEELQRAARFSSDASHQLKTPVTVLRAGLEGMLAEEHLSSALREELSALVHQTYRITSVVEDLLLLSRMEAGRQPIWFRPIQLAPLVEGLVDDLSVLPNPGQIVVEATCPDLWISGEEHFVIIILQNLVENARKYNRPGGRIVLACAAEGEEVIVSVGNTGPGIPAAAQEHIFERFHRGAQGENVPGHGLGLNLARELARLHGGELRLRYSGDDWTEFAVRFRLAPAPLPAYESA